MELEENLALHLEDLCALRSDLSCLFQQGFGLGDIALHIVAHLAFLEDHSGQSDNQVDVFWGQLLCFVHMLDTQRDVLSLADHAPAETKIDVANDFIAVVLSLGLLEGKVVFESGLLVLLGLVVAFPFDQVEDVAGVCETPLRHSHCVEGLVPIV